MLRLRGFWHWHQCTFFDVQVFNPLAPSNRRLPLPQCFRSHEREKRRAYEQRLCEVEHGSFTPLVFAAKVAWERQLQSHMGGLPP